MSHDNMNVQENLGNLMSDQILVLYCKSILILGKIKNQLTEQVDLWKLLIYLFHMYFCTKLFFIIPIIV